MTVGDPASQHVLKLLDAVTATGVGTVIARPMNSKPQGPLSTGVVQALITGTQTLTVEGSCDNTNWVTLVTFTSSDAQAVVKMPYMRGNCTARSSGAGTLWLAF